MPLLVPGVFLLLASFWRPVSPVDCCLIKTVRDASEDSKLNGVYILKAKEDSKPDPNCMDGCVYLKDNEDEEYCFIEKSGASVVCEVTKLLLQYELLLGGVLYGKISSFFPSFGSHPRSDFHSFHGSPIFLVLSSYPSD